MRKIVSACMCLVLTGLMLCILFPCAVNAASAVDPARSCALDLEYAYGGKGFAGLDIRIFRIAEVFEDGTYQLTGDFSDYPVNLYDITSQTEWKTIASTLSAYVAADELEAAATLQTDAEGKVHFDALQTGMYLTLSVKADTDKEICTFESFLICLPNFDEQGEPFYEVTAAPKCEIYEPKPENVEFKIIKQWKDAGNTDKRPGSVTVEILKDGKRVSIQILSTDNNWSYRWTAPDDGSVWQAVEREVPEDYKVAVVVSGHTIVVTNVYDYGYETPPDTGVTTVLWPYVLLMCLSGLVILILGLGRRKRVGK